MTEKLFIFIKAVLIGAGLVLTFATNSSKKNTIGTILCALAFLLSLIGL